MSDFEDTYVQLSTLVEEVDVPQLNDYDIRLCANDEGTAGEEDPSCLLLGFGRPADTSFPFTMFFTPFL